MIDREEVAGAISREMGAFGIGLKPSTSLVLADAAIAAVLEQLREPSKQVIEAFVRNGLSVKIGPDFGWHDYAVMQWQAMLDAAKDEAKWFTPPRLDA